MKKKLFVLIACLFAIAGCDASKGNISSINIDEQAKTTQKTGVLSDFDLISPTKGMVVEGGIKEFKWNASTNAETYTLEISSSDQFQSDLESVDYYKKENIVDTSFKINSSFQLQDTYYYWRVTAKNALSTKVCSEVFNFYIKAPAVEEFKFDLGEADDWKLHNDGSYADVSIDNSNFFGNNEKSLKVAFKEEDVNQGPGHELSDGWIIVTKSIEKSIYGTDALYFNCFYAGQDSTIFVRLVDRDNEYWHCQIQLSFNAQQSVILKFSDFKQRYGDVTVANEKFDYERIKYLEIVFEKTFGDGVFLISNVKAIKFDNYRDMFIQKLDFSEYDESRYTYENYRFEKAVNDKYELELRYYSTATEEHGKINGYGFAKVLVNRYMYTGDAVKMTVKYTGAKGKNVLLRIYEEDTDRWSYKIPFTSLTEGEYETIVIPYTAFGKSQVTGDGKRQFYYIINIQFGLEGQYGNGTLCFKDFEIVEKKNYVTETTREVGSDGLIENFDNYRFAADMFNIWTVSVDNKDEYLNLDNTFKVGSDNKFCGQFFYKADMFAALYYLPITAYGNFTSISLWLKDASIKPNDPKTNHISEVNADLCIYIRLGGGEIYVYEIKKLEKVWNQYDIPFTSFTLSNNAADPDAIQPAAITHIGISLQYYYYDANGKPMPLYAMDNPVYVDDIYLTNKTVYQKTLKEKILSMSDNVAMVDDFESYQTDDDMNYFWQNGYDYEYQYKELSTNVSSRGGSHSMKLQYQTNSNSPSYYLMPVIDSSVVCKAFRISIAAEKQATVYVNFYTMVNTNIVQYRATLTNVNTAWTEYVVGFDKLTNESGGNLKMTSPQGVYKISIGMTLYGQSSASLSNIYVDNFAFDATYDSYSVFTKTVID